MLTDKFTILELIDLALRVPEVGAVNFNILHSVLACLVTELNLESLKPPCYIKDEVAARAVLTRRKQEDPRRKAPAKSTEEIKGYIREKRKSVTEKEDVSTKESIQSKEKKLPDDEKKTAPDEKGAEDSDKEKTQQAIEVAKDILEKTTDDPVTDEDSLNKAQRKAVKAIAEKEIFEEDPAKVVQEMWRAININRRMDGAEQGLKEMSDLVDMIMDRIQDLEEETGEAMRHAKSMLGQVSQYNDRISECESECRRFTESMDQLTQLMMNESERFQDALNKNQDMTNAALKEMGDRLDQLSADLKGAKELIAQDIDVRMKELKNRIFELEDLIIPKEDFMELASQIENLEKIKVSREELGKLLEPGFVDGLLLDQDNLRSDVNELKEGLSTSEKNLDALVRRIDDEIVPFVVDSLEEHSDHINSMQEKLDLLDADDINDTFARIEEQVDTTVKEMQEVKRGFSALEKDAKAHFKQIADLSEAIKRLDATKVNKKKLFELLELKADVDMVADKLDRSEFVSVIKDIKGDLERLTIVVKINEENTNDSLRKIRHQLSLKMYTEDFITATEPIRNRIKAILYEQRSLKELTLAQLLPDAPGVVKCFSCKRQANLTGPKYGEFFEEKPTKETTSKLPPIDIDHLPIPPADKPRIQDAALLPVFFARATPHIGLTREKRRSDIDEELEEYLCQRKIRSIGGEHTKTKPQQRGPSYLTMKLPDTGRCEALLRGENKAYFKGSIKKQPESTMRSPSQESLHPTPVLHEEPSKALSDTSIWIPKT